MPLAENRAADADMGCAAFYRDWHISGHPHRQNICFDACRVQLSQQPLYGMKLAAQLIIAAVGLATHINPRTLIFGNWPLQGPAQPLQWALRRVLLLPAAMFTSMHTCNGGISDGLCSLKRRAVFRRPIVCTPMCAFGHKFGFIRLHIADNVPNNIRQIGQRFRFSKPFLNIVLAEIALTGRMTLREYRLLETSC